MIWSNCYYHRPRLPKARGSFPCSFREASDMTDITYRPERPDDAPLIDALIADLG